MYDQRIKLSVYFFNHIFEMALVKHSQLFMILFMVY